MLVKYSVFLLHHGKMKNRICIQTLKWFFFHVNNANCMDCVFKCMFTFFRLELKALELKDLKEAHNELSDK